jgi:hypothetical protein
MKRVFGPEGGVKRDAGPVNERGDCWREVFDRMNKIYRMSSAVRDG